jgi:ABC-type transporter Mla subunit MlaD
MTDAARNFWVGGFVVVSGIVLATLMAWFGETPDWLGGNEWTLEVIGVRELRGIQLGSPVHLNGVEIGRVKSLEFVDAERPGRGVTIVTRINERYSVPQGATARVYGAMLGIGTGHIDILVEAGAGDLSPLPKKGAQIRGDMRSIVNELITKDMIDTVQRTITNFGNFADAATPVAANLSKFFEPRTVAEVSEPQAKLTANVTTLVERIDQLVANLNVVLGDVNVQGDVKAVVHDLKTATTELRETMELWRTSSQKIADNLTTGIDKTEANLERSFVKLNELLDNLDAGAKSLATSLQVVAEGRGTAGLLVRDERLYEAALLSIQRFGEAMATVERILSKFESDGYITLATPSSLPFTKKFAIPAGALDDEGSMRDRAPSGLEPGTQNP